MDIDLTNVETFHAAMGELRKVQQNLRSLGLSQEQAHEMAFDAYELGVARANRIYKEGERT